ncbi:MAG: cupredoxin family copper-binding protein [Acidobacteriales bacterium]|nr:cupredoxin family copper-binding protein [Terriglobales bacterium]
MRIIRRFAVSSALAALALGLLCGLAGPLKATTNTNEITIDNFSFAPATYTGKVGTPITWINHDDIPHTVVSDDGTFKSKALDTDDKFTFTPAKAGTYSYFCSLHPKMTAKVIVEPEGGNEKH